MSEPEFDWSLGDAETTSTVEDDGHTENDDSDTDQARDPRGRFVAKEASGDSKDGSPDNSDKGTAGESKQDDDLLLGKFKSVDDLAEAYKNLEKHAGSQGNELGDLRKQVEEIKTKVDREPEPQYAAVDTETINALDELAEKNPVEAARWALQYQPLLYDRVMEVWFGNDPRGASRFETSLTLGAAKQEWVKEIAPALQPLQRQSQEQEFARAWATVGQKYPDMESHAEAMLEAAKTAPELAAALQSGDMASKERLIENLLFLARGRQADTLASAAVEAARTQKTKAQSEKLAAAVASGSSKEAREEKTGIAAWKEQFVQAPETSIWAGLETAKK